MVILFQKQGISKTGGSITEGQRIQFRKAATDPICEFEHENMLVIMYYKH